MRFWEIDFFRGIAIILMVIFNYAFTLRFFNIYTFDSTFFWFWFPRIIAGMFILIAGIALTISYSKNKEGTKKERLYTKYVFRGVKIFGLGLIITAITYIFVPQGTVLFGILHLIGLSIILSLFFINFRKLSLIAGIIIIVAGVYLSALHLEFSPLFFVIPLEFYTLDYFPLLPWLGVMLIGLFIGNSLYKKGKRVFTIFEAPKISKPLSFLGRHSLLIYVAHQPVLLATLYLLGYTAL